MWRFSVGVPPEEGERAAGAGELDAVGLVVPHAQAGVRGDRLVEAPARGDVGDADPEVVDDPARAQRAVMDGLGAVAVGIKQERPVVVAAVLGPRPRSSVLGVPGSGALPPELVDLLARGRDERDVEPPGERTCVIGAGQREVLPLREHAGPVGPVDTQWRQDRVVEALGRGPVGHADRHVVEHASVTRRGPESRLRERRSRSRTG